MENGQDKQLVQSLGWLLILVIIGGGYWIYNLNQQNKNLTTRYNAEHAYATSETDLYNSRTTQVACILGVITRAGGIDLAVPQLGSDIIAAEIADIKTCNDNALPDLNLNWTPQN